MTRRQLLAAFGSTAAVLVARRASADVNIGINVGIAAPPPPRLALAAPPPLVLVPGTQVHHVPSVGFNLFVFGGRYYSLHNDAWFVAGTYNGPWTAVAVEKVPKAVLAVPVTYYKIPPGHARKMAGEGGGHGRGDGGGPARGKGPKHKKGKDD